MAMLTKLFEMIWAFLQRVFAPVLGPFIRAVSLRRADDGSAP
jgi:hypothetical protein